MRRMLLTLLTSLVLLVSAVPVVRAATAAETEPLTPMITDAGPHRWVNEGGPYGGAVVAVALCAGEPDVLYAGSMSGVYKSVDGGDTWHAVSPLVAGGRCPMICHVAVDPKTSDTVYAISKAPVSSGDPNELYKSTDGGRTWHKLEPRPGWSFLRVAVDASDPNTLYLAAANHGVLKSTDGGTTWAVKNNGLWGRKFDLIITDEHDPDFLVVIMRGSSALFASDDGGATWRKTGGALDGVTIGALKRSDDDPRRLELEMHLRASPQGPQVSDDGGTSWHVKGRAGYAGYTFCGLLVDDEDPMHMEICVRRAGDDRREVYLTTDGAETWRFVELPFAFRALRALRASRSTDGVIFALAQEEHLKYYYSDDGGKTWEFFYSPEQDPRGEDTATIAELLRCRLLGFYDDRMTYSWALALHPTNLDVAYRTSFLHQGVVKTDDRGRTWTPVNNGLLAFCAYDIACDPKTPGLLYASGSGTLYAVYRSIDGARTWTNISKTERRWEPRLVHPLAVHPLDPRVILIGNGSWGMMSVDGGENWDHLEEPPRSGFPAAAFLFDPKNADHIYILTSGGVVATTDRGHTWQRQTGTFQCGVAGTPQWPEVRQTNTEIIYELPVIGPKTLRRSRDLGQTWEEVKQPASGEGTYSFVRVDPRDPKIVFAPTLNALFRSADAGDTWSEIELPEHCTGIDCIGLDPKDPDTFYLGGCGEQETVLRTRDGGKTFEKLGNGLPRVPITRVVVSPADGAVYAATVGAGVYRLETEPPSSD